MLENSRPIRRATFLSEKIFFYSEKESRTLEEKYASSFFELGKDSPNITFFHVTNPVVLLESTRTS